MSIFRKNSRLFGMPFQSNARRTNSNAGHLVCATVLAGFILCGGAKYAGAQQANVLLNPGAESGLADWTPSLTGYIYTVTTNGVTLGQTNLVHSGAAAFELFDTTGDQAYIYQDIACAPGSQWAGSVWAASYASNYMQAGESAGVQVSFYDATNALLTASNAANTVLGNTYGSDFLDPSATPLFYWELAPPMAVNSNGWVQLPATNIYDTDPMQEAIIDNNFNPTNILYAPPRAAKVRYMLYFTNSADSGGDAYFDDCVLQEVVGTDPDISTAPLPITVYASSPATFTVVGVKALKPEILTYQWQKNGTNLPAAGSVNDIDGATTN